MEQFPEFFTLILIRLDTEHLYFIECTDVKILLD